MPKINVTQPLLDRTGKPLRDPPAEGQAEGEVITLRAILIAAIDATLPAKEDPQRPEVRSPDSLTADFAASIRIFQEDEPHLSAKEVTMLLDRVARRFPSPIVYGQVAALLDPPAPAKAAAKTAPKD